MFLSRSAADGPRSSFPKPRRSVAHEALRFGGQPASPIRTCPTRCARRPDRSAIKPTQPRASSGDRAMRLWRSQTMAAPRPADRDLLEGLAGMLRQASGIDLRTQDMPPLTAPRTATSAQRASIVHLYVSTTYRLSAHPTASTLVTTFPSPGSIGGVPPPATRPLCGPKVLGWTTGTKRFSSILIWTACPRHSGSALSISCPRQRRPRRVVPGSAHATIRTARVVGLFRPRSPGWHE